MHMLYDGGSKSETVCTLHEDRGKEMASLQLQSPANWKAKVGIGEDMEAAMLSRTPAEKQAFRLGARGFHVKCTQYLLSRLPFDSAVLLSLRCLYPECKKSSFSDLRQLATKLPQAIPSRNVSAPMDKYTLLQVEPLKACSSEGLMRTGRRFSS